jgi:hypothetical protein
MVYHEAICCSYLTPQCVCLLMVNSSRGADNSIKVSLGSSNVASLYPPLDVMLRITLLMRQTLCQASSFGEAVRILYPWNGLTGRKH